MSNNQLQLTNVINISVSEAQAGIGDYNTSNLGLFSHEVYDTDAFGDLGYKIYVEPLSVGTDFGTNSETYKMAVAVFSQNPNILGGDGSLIVMPFVEAVQHLAFSGVAASGTFVLNYDGHATAAINWNDTAAQIQTKIIAGIPVLAGVSVTGSIAGGLDIALNGIYGPAALITVTSNSLATSVPAAITITVTTTQDGETIADAIARTADLVQYFGIIGTLLFNEADMLEAAAVVETLNKIAFWLSRDDASVQSGGMLDLLVTGSFHKNRGLYYGGATDNSALLMGAAYASRGLSVNFSGSNTTITMHLKDLTGIQPDPSMDQTLLTLCQAAGADVYVSLQGVPKVFCSGANHFFDQVYNLAWFVGALQVAGFNFLAQSSTKIPQTENGMSALKDAYRQVCKQAVTNLYSAPGTWNSPNTFGNLENFYLNISQQGYYIYSAPIGQQSPTARAARVAPLIQIALKEAGSIHSSDVIVNVNA